MSNPTISGGEGPAQVISAVDAAQADRVEWAVAEAERIAGPKPLAPAPYAEMPTVERVASNLKSLFGADEAVTPVLVPGSLDSANALFQAEYQAAMDTWQKRFDAVYASLTKEAAS